MLIDDIDAAIERVRRAATPEEMRRAVKNALDELYSLRTHREGSTKPLNKAYYRRAEVVRAGQVAEGLSLVRGTKAHDALKDVDPCVQLLYPGGNLFPGENTFPGPQLVWLKPEDMVDPLSDSQPRRAFYEDVVAGQPVMETLLEARDFLASDPGPSI